MAAVRLMQRSRPGLSRQVMSDSWQEGPANRWAFQHVTEILPCAVVSRGEGPVLPLVADHRDLARLRLRGIPGRPTLRTFLRTSSTDGLLVLRDGGVVFEQYLNGMQPTTRHLLQSVSKSLCGALTGELVGDGLVDLDAVASAYVPELSGSAFGDATVTQLLDMTASIEFTEEYADPGSDVQTQDRAAGWRPRQAGDPGNSYQFLRSLRQKGAHGRVFQYCSATTDALAWVLERATGSRYADLLADVVWSRIGAEHDAFITVDTAGFALANGGISVSLRDLARFGHLMLRGGSSGAHQAFRPEWVAGTRAGAGPDLMRGTDFAALYPEGSYRANWWLTGNDRGTFLATGIYGQYLWIDPSTNLVIAKLSSLPAALDPAVRVAHHRAFAAIAESLD